MSYIVLNQITKHVCMMVSFTCVICINIYVYVHTYAYAFIFYNIHATYILAGWRVSLFSDS